MIYELYFADSVWFRKFPDAIYLPGTLVYVVYVHFDMEVRINISFS